MEWDSIWIRMGLAAVNLHKAEQQFIVKAFCDEEQFNGSEMTVNGEM